MLVLKNGSSQVVVLDQADLLRLQTGPFSTPDGAVLIALSPDLPWTAAAFKEASDSADGLTTQKILAILATAIAKPAQGDA